MEEIAKLEIDLKNNTKIDYIVMMNNSRGIININNNKQHLNQGTIYKFLLKNSNLDLDNFHVIKLNREFREKIEILDIKNGVISLCTRIQGTVLKDNDCLGILL